MCICWKWAVLNTAFEQQEEIQLLAVEGNLLLAEGVKGNHKALRTA